MKRIVLIIILAACTFMAAAQEQSEKQLILKNGTAITGIVEVQTDGSYQLKTSAGDILYFAPSEVERVINGNAKEKKGKAKEKAIKVNEKVNNDSGPVNIGMNSSGDIVYRKGSNLRFTNTGASLTQEDFFDFASWEKYKKARSIRRWGCGLMIGGGVLVANGVSLVLRDYTVMDYIVGSNIIVGAAALVVGPLLLSNGSKKIKAIANAYNQHPGYALEFGPQQHGVGFALKF